MITDKELKSFILKLPPTPKILQKTLKYVNEGDLTKTAATAEQDSALSTFLRETVNRPVYGFRGSVKNINQIFGILGISAAQQLLYQYMMSLLLPNKFELFKLNKKLFTDLQIELTIKWNSILKHLNINDKEISVAITLLPSTITICEALFSTHKDEVALLRSVKHLDYNTILKRLSGKDFFDIAAFIAKKWELPPKVTEIIYAASGSRKPSSKAAMVLGAWMHLLLFQVLSKSEFIEAGLNDFVEFNVEYVSSIYEEYAELMEIA